MKQEDYPEDYPTPIEIIQLISAVHGLKLVGEIDPDLKSQYPGFERLVREGLAVSEKWQRKLIELEFKQKVYGKEKESRKEG